MAREKRTKRKRGVCVWVEEKKRRSEKKLSRELLREDAKRARKIRFGRAVSLAG